MAVPPKFRDRKDVEVEILDALVTRREDGMTVFELRSHVDKDIETLELALSELHRDGLITVEDGEHRSVILPDERVIPESPDSTNDRPFGWRTRRYLGIIRRFLGRP